MVEFVGLLRAQEGHWSRQACIVPKPNQLAFHSAAQEAALLLKAGVQPDSNCASKAIGYRQAMTFLQSLLDDPHASPDLEQLVSRGW